MTPPTSVYPEILATFMVTNPSDEIKMLTTTSSTIPPIDTIFKLAYEQPEELLPGGLKKSQLDEKLILYSTTSGRYGLLLAPRIDTPGTAPLRDFAAHLLLHGLETSHADHGGHDDTAALAHEVTSAFERLLLYDAFEGRGWTTGRNLFTKQVRYYTDNGIPIQMALPAFPCKTTNPEKAASSMPDGAEYEALANIHAFCVEIEKFYKPGCFINIVSDGHVFSDCQGTDDNVVEEYSNKLKEMVGTLQPACNGGIRFYNLEQLLFPSEAARELYKRIPAELMPPIDHPVKTSINPGNDEHRRLMLAVWGPPEEYYRDLIKSVPDHAITALYRGFSRFMFEDLAYSPDYRNATSSARKKAAEKVAFVMIQRNQTYSRLVEGVLPRHVRLSIHAHDNAGPKFAVRVLPWSYKAADKVDDLVLATAQNMTESSRSTLHIPTPWHNTLIQICDGRGGHQSYICRARLAVDGLENGVFEGGYIMDHTRGARYVLYQK